MTNTKVWIVAGAEFGMLARTKAFIITILLMPVLVAGSIIVQSAVAGQVDTTPRRFAVIDHSGALWSAIASLARERDAAIAAGLLAAAPFQPENVDPGARPIDNVRLEQSQRVRDKEIFAFVEIPADVLRPESTAGVTYHSDHPTYEDLRRWLEGGLNAEVQKQRLKGAGVDPEVVARLAHPVTTDHLGLLTRLPSGEVRPASRVDVVRTYVAPLGLMYILFLTVFMSAPQLMNAVMQEKMSKISEVLIGSISSFELMMGKLLGSAGVSFVLAVVYLGGGLGVAAYSGYGDAVSPSQMGFFLLFMVLAVLFYGSLFIAVGAACNDIKDAQSLITPVMLIAVVPMFAWQAVLKSPMSPFAIAISLFPPATPFMMLLRVSVQPGPPWWQVAAGLVLTGAAAVLCVFAAGKIFRVGILSQGKSASLAQIWRWLRVK